MPLLTRLAPARRAALLLAPVLLLPVGGAAAEPAYRWERGEGAFGLNAGGKTVWTFRHGGVRKPMFHPLALSNGTVLTWDAPPDHPWHHALWFSWKYLNRVNYWEPNAREPCGKEEWRDVKIAPRGKAAAAISLGLAYFDPAGVPVLEERRAIRVSAPDPEGNYFLDWTMTFTAGKADVLLDRTPPPANPGGVPHGGYAGLSIRLAKDFRDAKAVAAGPAAPVEPLPRFYRLSGARALDFNGSIAGQEAGVAFLDHPGNIHHPGPWYMVAQPEKPFLFAQAAVIYDKPYLLKAGQKFTLRYRVVVHYGRWDASRLGAAQERYVREYK